MSKKKISLKEPLLPALNETFKWFPFLNRKIAALIIIVTALIFYCTSINNEYALDDGIIIHQNDHVLKGVKGIKDILSKDAYESFYRRMCATDQLAGGRYRPLSVVSFALEQELIGTYRTGLYMRTEDLNKNSILDREKVNHITPCGRAESNYEYNDFIDRNADGIVQGNECYACWDLNHNFTNDRDEDINNDGIHNEVDCQLYGAGFRHFNNCWMYALGCYLLYLVFSTCFFRTQQDLAFLAAFLFTIHPIHSEAVANVKSRDEIFSLIFISLTFLYAFRYLAHRSNTNLLLCCVFFLLALLSKEYAVMLLMLVPFAVYTFTENDLSYKNIIRAQQLRQYMLVALSFIICAFIMTYVKRSFDVHAAPDSKPIRSFWLAVFIYPVAGIFLTGANKKKNFLRLLSWLFFVMLIYVGMRWNAVKLKPGVPNTEILNNPYLLATGEEQFCAKAYVLLKYIMLQVFPHPLSSDYSFDSIKYRHFTSPDFILSILLHLLLAGATIHYILKKHILGFAFLTYILFLLLIGNILMDIGATMGERLIFHSNIGFCIALAFLNLFLLEKYAASSQKIPRYLLLSVLLVITVLSGIKTWERNFDWKNDITLFLKDVQTMPNSVLCLGNAGARYVDLLSTQDFAVKKLPGYDSTFNDHNGTLAPLLEEVKKGKYKDLREAGIHHGIKVLKHAIDLHPRYVNGYLNMGLLYFQLRKDFEALYYWKNAERLYPNNPYLRSYYGVYENDLRNRAAIAYQHGRWDSVAIAYNKLTILLPANADAWYNLGGAYFNQQKYELARKAMQRSLQLNPGNADAKRVMAMIPVEGAGSVPIKN